MKISSLFFGVFLMLVSCGQKSQESDVELNLTQFQALSNGQPYIVYGNLVDSNPMVGFGKLVNSESADSSTFNMTLPNGKWKFGIVSWKGLTSGTEIVLDPSTALPMECGESAPIVLNGAPVPIKMTLNEENCHSWGMFEQTTESGGVVTGTGVWKFNNHIKLCSTYDESTNVCTMIEAGIFYSARIVFPTNKKAEIIDEIDDHDSTGTNEEEIKIVSACTNLNTPGEINLSNIAMGLSTRANLPYYATIKIYSGNGCIDANYESEIEFMYGLGSKPRSKKIVEGKKVLVDLASGISWSADIQNTPNIHYIQVPIPEI